jgi:hypothetical protein
VRWFIISYLKKSKFNNNSYYVGDAKKYSHFPPVNPPVFVHINSFFCPSNDPLHFLTSLSGTLQSAISTAAPTAAPLTAPTFVKTTAVPAEVAKADVIAPKVNPEVAAAAPKEPPAVNGAAINAPPQITATAAPAIAPPADHFRPSATLHSAVAVPAVRQRTHVRYNNFFILSPHKSIVV